MKKPKKHTIATLQAALIIKNIHSFVSIVSIENDRVTVKDTVYGEYAVGLKSFCDSEEFPLHKNRRHAIKMEKAASKVVGTQVNGYKILSLFYGPDRGYKNRSFYVEYIAGCGHPSTATQASLKNHKDPGQLCSTCAKTKHGARSKNGGERVKRTPTYIYWQKNRQKLPIFLQEFSDFRRILGDKPYTKAEVIIEKDRAYWRPLIVVEDKEINLMATALRQAFRFSEIYKKAIESAKVETTEGTRYTCALCGNLVKRTNIQVDHIEPIAPLDGRPLKKEEIIDRVWTTKIQILDKTCHSKKSALENKTRRENRKVLK